MPSGLNSEDLRKRAAVNGLERSPTNHTGYSDPLDAAIADSRKIAANRIMQQQITNQETETIKLENERLKAQIEQQELKESAHSNSGSDTWRDYLLKQMDGLQGALIEAQKNAQSSREEVIQERMNILTGEIQRLRESQQQPAEKPNVFEEAKSAIESARGLVNAVTPEMPPPMLGYDPSLEKWKLTLEDQREQRRLEAEEKRRSQEIDLQLKREQLEREQARLDKEAATQQRFMEESLPKVIAIGEQLITTFQQRFLVAAQTAPVAEPQVAAQVNQTAKQPPPGIEAMTCQRCSNTIYYKSGDKSVVCPSCFAVYEEDVNDVPEEAPIAAQTAPAANPSALYAEFDENRIA